MNRKRMQGCLVLLCVLGAGTLNAQQDSLPAKSSAVSSPPTTYDLLYQVRDRKKNTAAVTEIYQPELLKNVSPSFGGWLTGRMAGLYTYQGSGQPGFDDVSLTLRGQTPFVMIDGTPQSFPSINPEQIQSVTLLKDAVSGVMMGMRSSGGIVLLTTRKGEREQGQHIEFNAMYGVQRPTRLPKFVGAADYATLYNEALANDGLAPVYTQNDITAFRDGSDPIGHPNVDWQKQILEEQAPFSKYDFSIYGGNKSTRYFVNLDYLQQKGLLKTQDFNTYNTNADYSRYILRSNLEVDLSKAITTSLNLFGRIQNTNQPGVSAENIFTNMRNTPNGAYPVLNSDGSLGGALNYQNNIYGQSVLSGYSPVYERDFKVDFSLKGNLDVITKGLWVKGLAAINAYQRETTNRSKTFAVYTEGTDGAGAKTYTKYGITGDQQNTATANSQNRLFYTELSFGYNTALTANDNLEALVVASNDHRMVNSELALNFTGVAAKISYDHKAKYFVDLAAGYNGTERYPQEDRYALFPAIGLGWDITNETFLKNKISWLSHLKLRASVGKTGNANVGYYEYNQYYVTGTGYGFGSTVPSSSTTLQQGVLANPLITWEKADKISAGIEATLFGEKLNITADYFNDKYYDLVQTKPNGSDILGTTYVRENIGSNRYSGFEFQASWRDSYGDFSYFISPNFSVLKTKVLEMYEPQRMYAYLTQTGKPVNQAYGYVAEGLFANQAEIDAHAFQGGTIVPGDIKYKDLNNDGLIDGNDQQAIGSTSPFIYYGVNMGVSFKGIDLAVLLQGHANSNLYYTGNRAFQNNGFGQAYEEQLNRWTPQNTTNAGYPRLWVGNNANNTLMSSYWMKSNDYMRIKSIELGYTIPGSVSRKAGLSVARLYVNATNLFTFSSLNDFNIDPEGINSAYPIMKTINAGITIKL